MPLYSQNLKILLRLEEDNFDSEIDMSQLAGEVATSFGDKARLARAFLANTNGRIKIGTVSLYLLDLLNYDSAVRDIQTSGHLAKLLSRFEVFRQIGDGRVLGMPHDLFDNISQAERADFFERGGILEIDGELLNNPKVRTMLDDEAQLLEQICKKGL